MEWFVFIVFLIVIIGNFLYGAFRQNNKTQKSNSDAYQGDGSWFHHASDSRDDCHDFSNSSDSGGGDGGGGGGD